MQKTILFFILLTSLPLGAMEVEKRKTATKPIYQQPMRQLYRPYKPLRIISDSDLEYDEGKTDKKTPGLVIDLRGNPISPETLSKLTLHRGEASSTEKSDTFKPRTLDELLKQNPNLLSERYHDNKIDLSGMNLSPQFIEFVELFRWIEFHKRTT